MTPMPTIHRKRRPARPDETAASEAKVRWFTDARAVEPEAAQQIRRTASMPFVLGLAVMPDVHLGKGSTVGTVIAMRGAIMPACVGVDIGCGMIAVQTTLTSSQIRPHLRNVREGIERHIPLGIGKAGENSRITPSAAQRAGLLERMSVASAMDGRASDWPKQLGSLGGGNHFIEISEDESGSVWVFLHSGSRRVGNKTGMHWTWRAQAEARARGDFDTLPDRDLAYLEEGSEIYEQYILEAEWCQHYAELNREEMMERALAELSRVLGGVQERRRIQCHHNYLSREGDVVVTRKGAIDAHAGVEGLIPGSMASRSYVVIGLGNATAYHSAPHGAGRRFSRTAARKQFSLEDLERRMAGIESRLRPQILDEHPGAYKDIEVVMSEARTLVRPDVVLRQLISIKGD
jgi:tRNA-splicing ligase RtcB